jgi:hypothetical protein
MNFNPRLGQCRVERVLGGRGLGEILQAIGAHHSEADKQGSARADEIAACESGAQDVDRSLAVAAQNGSFRIARISRPHAGSFVFHARPPFAISVAASCTAWIIAV